MLTFKVEYVLFVFDAAYFTVISCVMVYFIESTMRKQWVDDKNLILEIQRAKTEMKRSEKLILNILPSHMIDKVSFFILCSKVFFKTNIL
jgi:hypothetical protein